MLDSSLRWNDGSGRPTDRRERFLVLSIGRADAGTPLADDALVDSDLLLPPADATIDEVRELLDEDGLIPG